MKQLSEQDLVRLLTPRGKVIYGCRFRNDDVCPCEETDGECQQRDPVYVTIDVPQLLTIINNLLKLKEPLHDAVSATTYHVTPEQAFNLACKLKGRHQPMS